jgi:hypothetical protein
VVAELYEMLIECVLYFPDIVFRQKLLLSFNSSIPSAASLAKSLHRVDTKLPQLFDVLERLRCFWRKRIENELNQWLAIRSDISRVRFVTGLLPTRKLSIWMCSRIPRILDSGPWHDAKAGRGAEEAFKKPGLILRNRV